MDAPLVSSHDLVRPWRRATLVASAIAAIELVILLVGGAMLVAKPLAHAIRHHAQTAAVAPGPSKQAKQAIHRQAAPPAKARPRDKVKVMVLNGNGQNGAAGTAASNLHGLGYVIAGTANATHENYASTVVMYRRGYRAEGLRLAHDVHAKVVGPLDGIKPSTLDGGQVVVIVGA